MDRVQIPHDVETIGLKCERRRSVRPHVARHVGRVCPADRRDYTSIGDHESAYTELLEPLDVSPGTRPEKFCAPRIPLVWGSFSSSPNPAPVAAGIFAAPVGDTTARQALKRVCRELHDGESGGSLHAMG